MSAARRLLASQLRRNRGFVREPPAPRNAVEIFAGEWASRLPAPAADVPTGAADLFDDPRLHWAAERLRRLRGGDVLELGPLEGGHTAMALAAGARSVTAVEANTGAYLRCLVVKEVYGLRDATFLCGDFDGYLDQTDRCFDVGLAVGVLYHSADPVRLLARLAQHVGELVLWTHYYDADRVRAHATLRRRIRSSAPHVVDGFAHTLHRHDYGRTTAQLGFLGGTRGHSSWLSRDDILGALDHLGWGDVELGADEPDHPNGPALTLVARRV